MGKRRFFDRPSGLTIAKIISLTGAECADARRLSHLIADVAPLDLAGPNDLTFIESGKYADGPTARLENGVTVDPGAVIGPRAEIGAGSIISATAVIGPDVLIGRGCTIGAGCSIVHALIGDRVVIHPGCHIGQDGFGYIDDATQQKIPQTGRVIIQNDVEIGAGTTIDRGGIRDTIIGEATKIDNLCQIGHNVVIGRHCVIVAQSGLSGSVTLEDFAVLGGAVGLAPHVTIGRGGRVAARSGVMNDVPPGETWGGYPAKPRMQWMRQQATLARLTASSDKAASFDRQAHKSNR